MSKIKILSEHLANQIAAGEVIERPASVVKELLENSIDAGASQVQIEIAGSGTKLIRVIDDGMGMDSDDVLLCLERHATSKLAESAKDSNRLSAISTLGFRGEAIPSIASVAKMSITSRTDNEPLGTRVEVRYGKIVKVHETGCNKGTVIEIKDLFGNLPARKKFLKSAKTELFHIEEVIKSYALAFHRLGITYSINNGVSLNFSPDRDTLEERVKQLFARNTATSLIPLGEADDAAAGAQEIVVNGFLLSPEQSFATSSKLRLFVNGRAVKDRMIVHAVNEGLSGYLMKGRTAAGAVFISVPYTAVDVNVHPAKHEVRFREPNRIHEKIVSTVRSAMDSLQHSTRRELFGSNFETRRAEAIQRFPFEKTGKEKQHSYGLWHDTPEVKPARSPQTVLSSESFKSSIEEAASIPAANRGSVATAEPTAAFTQTLPGEIPAPEFLKPIGQFMDLYLLCEAKREGESYLVIIDQHAVHERILFEHLKQQFAARQMTSQNLLFPKMLELDPDSASILERYRQEVEQLGLKVEEFGGDSYLVKAVPAVLSHIDPEEILQGFLMEFSGSGFGQDGGRKRADAARLDDILASMACKAAIKAGQNLDSLELQELLKLMQKSKAFTHCPHGRPVVRMFSATDIQKWFHRT